MHHFTPAAAAWLLALPGGLGVRPEKALATMMKEGIMTLQDELSMAQAVRASPTGPVMIGLVVFLVGSFLLVSVPGVFFGVRRCIKEEEGAEADDAEGLRSPALAWWCSASACVGIAMIVGVGAPTAICAAREPAYASVLAPPGGNPAFLLDNMSVLPPQGLYAQLREQLDEVWTHEASGYTYGTAGVHEAPLLLYNGTRIEGVWERVPSPVRGVFWMAGNGIPEILATLQNAEWFEEEQILVLPNFPFSWTWYGGSEPPSGASLFANAYNTLNARNLAESMGEGNNSVAVSFMPCPKGHYCEAGSTDFTYADVKAHDGGDLTGMSLMYRTATWTMELDETASPKYSRWYRRTSIMCEKVEFGSYWLTKILDENGERIEPHYSNYVEYMEGASQIMWAGFGEGNHLV